MMANEPKPNFPPGLAEKVPANVVQCANCGCIFSMGIAVPDRGRWLPCPHCSRIGPDAFVQLYTVTGERGCGSEVRCLKHFEEEDPTI